MVRIMLGFVALLLSGPLATAASMTSSCADRSVAAASVATRADVKAFVNCAYEYVQEVGTEVAYEAFHTDGKWLSGPIYVFLLELIPSAAEATVLVNPAVPEQEGSPWGSLPDTYSEDIIADGVRIAQTHGSGWWFYNFFNPDTGRNAPKVSYIRTIDWGGTPAIIGAGVYQPGLPATCGPDHVNAGMLDENPTDAELEAFVRCAAILVEDDGYSAMDALRNSPTWNSGRVYVYVMDLMGNQVLTGSRIRVNRWPIHEWGGRSEPSDQFGGRSPIDVASIFGESYVYYRSYDPANGALAKKVGFLKRVSVDGVPMIVGAGYFAD